MPSVKMNMEIWKRFFKEYVKPNYFRIGLSVILMIIVAVSTAASAHLIDPIINDVFIQKDLSMLRKISLWILLVFFVKSFCTYLYKLMMSMVQIDISNKIAQKLFGALMLFDMSNIAKYSTGKIMTYFNNDARNVHDAIDTIVLNAAKEFFTIIFLVVLMFWKSWILSIISLFGFPLAFYPLIKLTRKIRRIAKTSQIAVERMNTHLQNSFDGIKTIKAYCNEDSERSKMYKIINDIQNFQIKTNKIGFIGSPMMEFMGGLAIAMVISYGGYQVIKGLTTAGSFFSFLTALLMLYKPAKSASNFSIIIQNSYVSLIRIFEIIDTKSTICGYQNSGNMDINLSSPSIEYKNVSFSYKAEREVVLSDINIKINSGQKIAIVGHSGGGKSTIANLLLRFYDVNSGSVNINGVDIKDINIKHLRNNISYVGQDSFLFDDTIMANICYGIDNPSSEAIQKAIEISNVNKFIDQIPNGLYSKVGHLGNTLSVGQKQRIIIARAILKNSPIIILDEATSALDNKTEKEIQDALHELIKDKTTLIIAHRLSTIANSDFIYLIDQGSIVEIGKHDELMQNEKSEYYKLWHAHVI